MDAVADHLANNIRQLREARGLTQQQMAKISGVPRPTWANLESGAANPTLAVLIKVAAALQVSLDELEAGTLGSLLPELPMLLECEVVAPPALDPSGARLRLFHVVGELLARLPETTLVLLEDLQWADSESLALLSHLCSGISRRALLLVASHREDEGSHTVETLPQLRKLRLPRLQRKEMEELCASMIGRSARHRELLDLVAAETEGNAYFIVEVMRALAAEAGTLAAVGRLLPPAQVTAGGVRTVLQRRLQRVPAAAQPLLLRAAVAGRQLDLALLGSLERDLERWLHTAAAAGVLELYEERWRFSHDKIGRAHV